MMSSRTRRLGADLHPAALPDGLCRVFGHQGQLVHCPLGADFLDGANGGVGNGDHQKHHVFIRAGNDQQSGQNEKNQVEKGQGVFPDDLPLRLGGGFARIIGPARGQPRLDLGLRETKTGVCVQDREGAAGNPTPAVACCGGWVLSFLPWRPAWGPVLLAVEFG